VSGPAPTYRLVAAPASTPAPVRLDPAQRAVVEVVSRRGCGPVLLLAGPGTGKTTTLVEAVAQRVERGCSPDRVLTLTFSRRAASELRRRLTLRLGRALSVQPAWTFHAFALSLVAASRAAEDAGRPLRLLSAPEQDVVVRELLLGDRVDGRRDWPEELVLALGTRGFADEVRTLLARARSFGLEPPDLAALARAAGRSDWSASARFLDDYLTVLDDLGAVDYAELVHRAAVHAEGEVARHALRDRFDLVVVDEYQDTDPGQERLLRALAGDGRDLLAVGDPDQSIYAFRGADVRGLLDFRDRFRGVDGSPARVLTLNVSRRAGRTLLTASRRLAVAMPLAGAGLSMPLREHRALRPGPDTPDGAVEVCTFPSAAAQLEAVGDLLRREHLDAGTPWGSMAVLVRSGARSIPLAQRVLGGVGVPIEVAGDELPLVREAAVAPLLLALRVITDPAALTQEAARALLLSPLGALDASGLRRLGRRLRARERTRGAVLPRPSAELVREALAQPSLLGSPATVAEVPESRRPEMAHRPADPAVSAARALGELLHSARELADRGASTHEVLWHLWDSTAWPRRLERQSLLGGREGHAADRDLDAVVALFDAAARDEERGPRRAIAAFLDELTAQQIPADTLAERGTRGDAVRLLTAHRSKGLEWDVVVVCDVQEDSWPDLRRRASVLEADRLDRFGLVPPPSRGELLAEERRLFYVAVTRARRRLVVTAVDSPEDDGSRPSRFLAELGTAVEARTEDASRRPLTLSALVRELRQVVTDPAADSALRSAAAARLARLAAARAPDGTPLVPAAHPDRWWGLEELSVAAIPLFAPEEALVLSASSLTGITDCRLRWFLDHEVGGREARGAALGFGSVVHALADAVERGDAEPDAEALSARLDRVWDRLAFEAAWQSESQRTQAVEALRRFLAWRRGVAAHGRRLVGSEVRFEVTVPVGDRAVTLRGSMDRVELDADGAVVVVDLKTGRTPPTQREVDEHPQLGLYQLAVRAGALDCLPEAAGRPPGGAELVHLREDRRGLPYVQRQPAPAADAPVPVEELLESAVAALVTEDFAPTPGPRCGRCQYRTACPALPEGRGLLP